MRLLNTTKKIIKGTLTLTLLCFSSFVFSQSTISLNIIDITPHLGQKFEARVVDMATGEEMGRYSENALANSSLTIDFEGLTDGHTYHIDFYADKDISGKYDAPPIDHAWREVVEDLNGDKVVDWTHNTDFTDISWQYALTLDLNNLDPHIGQMFQARLVNTDMNEEVGRFTTNSITNANMQVVFGNVSRGFNYRVDFYADLNGNNLYDAPPTDHAWSENIPNVDGDEIITWNHNTNFTDIEWPYKVTLVLENMDPHLGQMFEARLTNTANNEVIGTVTIDQVEYTTFEVYFIGAENGVEYNLDFYADLNGSGNYNAPPTDHAWRETITVNNDMEVLWMHNLTFTDIMWTTSTQDVVIDKYNLKVYPNPVNDDLTIHLNTASEIDVTITDVSGRVVKQTETTALTKELNITGMAELKPGIYYATIIINGTEKVNIPISKH